MLTPEEIVRQLLDYLVPGSTGSTIPDPAQLVRDTLKIFTELTLTPTSCEGHCGSLLTIRYDDSRFVITTALDPLSEGIYHFTIEEIPVMVMISEEKTVIVRTDDATFEMSTRVGRRDLTYCLLTSHGTFRYYQTPDLPLTITHLTHPAVERITWYRPRDGKQILSIMMTNDDYREPMVITLDDASSVKSIYYYIYCLYHYRKEYDQIPLHYIDFVGGDTFDSAAWIAGAVSLLD